MLAILCKPQDKHGEGGPEKPLIKDKAPPLLLHPLPYLLSNPNVQNLLRVLPPPTGNGRKRVSLMYPSSYQI
jgi:hypothetical protein